MALNVVTEKEESFACSEESALVHTATAAAQHAIEIGRFDSNDDTTTTTTSYELESLSNHHWNNNTNLTHRHVGSIGKWGSMAIAVNSLTGPAMLNLPATFQRSGIIPTTLALVFVCGLSALCSLYMANVISKVPGNSKFHKEVEYSDAFGVFWGQRWFLCTQVLFFGCILCLNISSIVDTAQVVDTFAGHFVPGGSVAVQFHSPTHIAFTRWDATHCSENEVMEGTCIPFQTTASSGGGLLLTAGYLVSATMLLPLALMDLKENASFQILGFVVLLIHSAQFAIQFFLNDGMDPARLSLWGDSWDELFGVVLFNFALVIAVPAWLYEKDPKVNVPQVVHGSSVLSTMLYVVVGITGALAIPNVSDNMLESMMTGAFGPTMALGASIFAFFIIGLGSPLFSVLTRMNLTGNGSCNLIVSERLANVLAVYLPWSISWMLYDGVTELLAWGGVLFLSALAFILPLLLALHTVLEYDAKGSISIYPECFLSSCNGNKQMERKVLYVLLGVATGSVLLAILGQVIGDLHS